MRVAIVHYHLRRGGVTRVIENTVASLAGRGLNTVVAAAEPYTGQEAMNTVVVPGLGYTRPNEKPDASALTFSLKTSVRKALGGEPDIWHIHNHSLGKNNAMPQVVSKLAREAPLLLQIHDFAEDGRPDNYRVIGSHLPTPQMLYPVAEHIHYAVLNGRDLLFMKQAGMPVETLHLMPNPVAPPSGGNDFKKTPAPLPGIPPDSRLTLYPTRAIRRKNLGEMLLWALLAEPEQHFGSTLIPANPQARKCHDQWQTVANELKLPVSFGLGIQKGITFTQLMQAADTILTTSIAEGFGLAFLEPWLFDKPLCGRDLPEITGDFRNIGIDLKHLYPRLDIPLRAVGSAALRQALETALPNYYAAYGCKVPDKAVQQAWQAIVSDERVDFGGLSEPLQESALRNLAGSPSALGNITPQPPQPDPGVIRSNHKCITDNFNATRYGDNLSVLYQKLAGHAIGRIGHLAEGAVLEQFLSPARFRLLRS